MEPVLSPLGLDPARPFSAHPEQRASISSSSSPARTPSGATARWPWCRRRVRSQRVLPAENGRQRLVALSTIVEAFVARLFTGMQVTGVLPVPPDAQQRPVRRRRRGRRPARALEASSRTAATARRCGSRLAVDCPHGHGQFPAAAVCARTARLVFGAGTGESQPPRRRSTTWSARPDLKYTPFTPGLAEGFSGAHDLFDAHRASATCCCTIRFRASRP